MLRNGTSRRGRSRTTLSGIGLAGSAARAAFVAAVLLGAAVAGFASREARAGSADAQPAANGSAGSPEGTSAVTPPPEPFAFADFSWVPGGAGASEKPLKLGPFTGEFRLDTVYHYSFNHPKDDTIGGSSEVFRHGEFQVTQIGFGGDFLYKNVQARLMTQFGMYSVTTPRNDASPGRGQWQLDNAYRYISEAYGGYHIDAMNGINIQAGIFMSYVGLWSYYNFDNWTYQPSYVSSNTPWFFNGVRVQIFPTDKLKIEPWLINGWQSYGRFNNSPGGGVQVLWRPNGRLAILGNQYYGTDTLGNTNRARIHTDDSVMWKYHEAPGGRISKAAASLTLDAGCERGGGVSCGSQYFLGFMVYNRLWFDRDRFGLTIGGGAINNPGRYLVLVPPINGATAFYRNALLHRQPRRLVPGVGRAADVRLHAAAVRRLPPRVQPPGGRRSVLLRSRGRDPRGRQHGRPQDGGRWLHPGSRQGGGPAHVRPDGEILTLPAVPARGEIPMLDLLCIAMILAFFAVSVVLTRGCERLEQEEA